MLAPPVRSPKGSEPPTIHDTTSLPPSRRSLRLVATLRARPHLGDVYTLAVYLDEGEQPEGVFRLTHHRHGDWYLGEQERGEPAPSAVHEAITSRLANAWPEELAS